MPFELTLTIKLIIAAVIIIAAYFILKIYFDMDVLVAAWELISELEFNWTVLVITLIGSVLLSTMIWKSPLWVSSDAFGFKEKLFLTIGTPIMGYIMGMRAWNKHG